MKIVLGGSKHNRSDFAASALGLAAHVVDRIGDETEALEFASASACDAVVICPETICDDLCQAVSAARACLSQCAIIVMPARADIKAIDALFRSGANDIITARDGKHVLLARFTAVIRRAWGHATPNITVGALNLCLTDQTCTVGPRNIPLTVIEYRLMEALALRSGQVILRQGLLELLYQNGTEPLPKAIDLFAYNIRRKLSAAGAAAYLASSGRGLVLRHEEAEAEMLPLSASAA